MPQASPQIAAARIADLNGKAILITGASTGIGAALARAFAAQGAKVGLHYHSSQEAAETLAAEIAAAGGTVFLAKADAGDPRQVTELVKKTAAHFGHLDGLINNAGGMLGRVATPEISEDQYDAVMDLNARSVLTATRAALPFLKKQGGFIINTTSIAARNGGAGGSTLYAASKGFVSTITRGHSKEFIPFGIRVNGVAPGVIATPFHDRYSSEAQMAAMKATIPQGRIGTVEDCVGAYLFLASEALSGYVIGQIIEVNGGQLMP